MPELWRVEVDGAQCVGSAMCVHLASENFELDAGTRSRPRRQLGDFSQDIADAAALCPAGAIGYSPVFTSSASELGSETE